MDPCEGNSSNPANTAAGDKGGRSFSTSSESLPLSPASIDSANIVKAQPSQETRIDFTEIPKVDVVDHAAPKEAGLYPNLAKDFAADPQEECDPLRPSKSHEVNADCDGDLKDQDGPVPPDGGVRAWAVMVGSFLCNGIIFGTINSGGVIFTKLKEIFEDKGVENPASYASLTLSLAIGTTFFLSMIAGVLTDKFGIRLTTIAGGFFATLGMFLSSIYFTQEGILVFTMGVIFGIGASLAYTPSLVILGHYFRKRIGIVNGIVTAGSSIFTIILTKLIKVVIASHGLKVAFRMLSGLMAVLMVCGAIFKPFLPDVKNTSKANVRPGDVSFKAKCRKFFGQFINFEIWRNKKYVIWTIAIPSALFGYFVPYVHLVEYAGTVLKEDSYANSSALNSSYTELDGSALNSSFAELYNSSSSATPHNATQNGTDPQSEILVQCIGLTSLLGRILFGFLADRPGVDRILLQQISFFCIGTLTMLLTVANAFWMFVVITLGMGLFDGCFISLLGPIALDIVGPDGVSQAIGCLLGMCSIPLTLGPYIAGVIEDNLDSYVIPFLCAGIPPILGCFALCLLKCVKEPTKDEKVNLEKRYGDGQEADHTSAAEAEALMDEKEPGASKPKAGEIDEKAPKRFVVIQKESSI